MIQHKTKYFLRYQMSMSWGERLLHEIQGHYVHVRSDSQSSDTCCIVSVTSHGISKSLLQTAK